MIQQVLIFALISLAIPLAIALILIASQRPGPVPTGKTLDFTSQLAQGAGDLPVHPIPMRDGTTMPTRILQGPAGAPLLILIHGSGWQGQQYATLGPVLADTATVLIPDLRGHGAAPARRGDVDYIGQMEDDIADLITAHATPGQKVILLGHSSGGGLVVRFAGGAHRPLIHGAVLLSPYLKFNAPTARLNSGGWAHPLSRRIIGLVMLNTVGIRVLNHLTAIRFAMPKTVLDGSLGHTATTAYSYRLNTGFSPRNDYLKDIAQLPPFTLIAGSADEAFVADAYQPTMSAVTDQGRYHLILGASHLSVVTAPETAALIAEFLDGL